MALKSTIFKITLHIADMDRDYYHSHQLTIAQHPSETNLRMMTRVVAFILNADEALIFGKGVSDEEEPALWQKTITDDVSLWIELGQPDEKRLKKASVRADLAKLYGYQSAFDVWWQQNKQTAAKFSNLTVERFDYHVLNELADLVERTMDIQASIQDGQLWLTIGDQQLLVETEALQ